MNSGAMGDGMGDSMGEMQMPCAGVPNASLVAGIVLAVLGIIFIIAGKKKVVSTLLGLLNVIAGVVVIGIPTFIVGVCGGAHMHCHMVTRPALIIIGAVIVIAGAVNTAIELSQVVSKDGEDLKRWLPEKEKIIAG